MKTPWSCIRCASVYVASEQGAGYCGECWKLIEERSCKACGISTVDGVVTDVRKIQMSNKEQIKTLCARCGKPAGAACSQLYGEPACRDCFWIAAEKSACRSGGECVSCKRAFSEERPQMYGDKQLGLPVRCVPCAASEANLHMTKQRLHEMKIHSNPFAHKPFFTGCTEDIAERRKSERLAAELLKKPMPRVNVNFGDGVKRMTLDDIRAALKKQREERKVSEEPMQKLSVIKEVKYTSYGNDESGAIQVTTEFLVPPDEKKGIAQRWQDAMRRGDRCLSPSLVEEKSVTQKQIEWTLAQADSFAAAGVITQDDRAKAYEKAAKEMGLRQEAIDQVAKLDWYKAEIESFAAQLRELRKKYASLVSEVDCVSRRLRQGPMTGSEGAHLAHLLRVELSKSGDEKGRAP